MGGEIVYYIANKLTERGQEVKYLALFDPSLPQMNVEQSTLETVKDTVDYYIGLDGTIDTTELLDVVSNGCLDEDIFYSLAEKLNSLEIVSNRLVTTEINKRLATTEVNRRLVTFLKAGFDLFRAEKPQLSLNLDSSLRLVVASDRPDIESYVRDWKLFSCCEIISNTIQANHAKMFDEPYLMEIIEIVKSDLDNICNNIV
jgi:thioesterase domain-containing protein